MSRHGRQTTPSPEVEDAFVRMFQGVFANMMKGLLKSQDVEERYVSLNLARRRATEEDIESLATVAAKYFVEHSPNVGGLSREEVDRLKKDALDHALNS